MNDNRESFKKQIDEIVERTTIKEAPYYEMKEQEAKSNREEAKKNRRLEIIGIIVSNVISIISLLVAILK